MPNVQQKKELWNSRAVDLYPVFYNLAVVQWPTNLYLDLVGCLIKHPCATVPLSNRIGRKNDPFLMIVFLPLKDKNGSLPKLVNFLSWWTQTSWMYKSTGVENIMLKTILMRLCVIFSTRSPQFFYFIFSKSRRWKWSEGMSRKALWWSKSKLMTDDANRKFRRIFEVRSLNLSNIFLYYNSRQLVSISACFGTCLSSPSEQFFPIVDVVPSQETTNCFGIYRCWISNVHLVAEG